MKIRPAFTFRTALSNFAAWIVYGIAVALGHQQWAYVGGLTVSVCQIAFQLRARRHFKILDGINPLFFLVGLFFTSALHSLWFTRNSSVLIWSMCSVVAWGSLLVRSPFTALYAKDALPRVYWDSPSFRRGSITITAAWGGVFVLNAVVATALKFGLASEHTGPSFRYVLQAAPYVNTIIGIIFTNKYPQWANRLRGKVNAPPRS